MGQAGNLVHGLGAVELHGVGQQSVHVIAAGLGLVPHGGAGNGAAVHGLGQVDHLHQFVLDVGGLGAAVVLGHGGRGADDDVGHAHLTAAVVLPVVGGEGLHKLLGQIVLAAHEHPVPGHEHVVEHGEGLAAHDGVLGVAAVDVPFQPAVFVGLAAENVDDPRRVHGDGGGHGIVLVLGPQVGGGQDQHLMGIDHPRLVGLGPPDHDAVLPPLHNVDKEVRVGLLAGLLAAVALGVGHGPGHHDVGLLDILHILLQPLMVIRAVLLVDLVGGDVRGVQGVEAHAALETGAGLLPDHAHHLDLFHQVLGALVHVGEAVDLLTGKMGRSGHQVFVLGVEGQFVGQGGRVHVGGGHGIVHDALDLSAVAIYNGMEFPQAVLVLLSIHHGDIPPKNKSRIFKRSGSLSTAGSLPRPGAGCSAGPPRYAPPAPGPGGP